MRAIADASDSCVTSYLEQEKRRKTQQQGISGRVSENQQIVVQRSPTHDDCPDLSSLAPLFVIQQVVDDWFELIHPLAPILHRDGFLKQLHDPSQHEADFKRLVFSVCAATVTTLRRKALAYATTVTVGRCYQLIRELDREREIAPATLTRCQIKYNLAVALGSERGMDDLNSQMLLAEATTIIGRIVHYEMQGFQVCERELAKRLYWLCFAGQW